MAQAAAKHDCEETQGTSQGSHGTFCWNELMTRDIERAKRFYRDTIGWTFEPMPMDWGTYWIAKSGDKNGRRNVRADQPRISTACRRAGCPISPSTTSMPASPRR